MSKTVAILIYPEVEVLDFAGPFEVFSTACRVAIRDGKAAAPPFTVFTAATAREPVRVRGGLMVLPHYALGEAPKADVLIVPGGVVTEPLENPATLAWIERSAQPAEIIAAVCTGAFLLGRVGLLDGLTITTHWEDIADLRRMFPRLTVVDNKAWVDQGKFVTSGGISAGIDMSLYLVGRLLGTDVARATARQMEYRWREEP
jgi:transcriptional regulator GlxA family with amidase domain